MHFCFLGGPYGGYPFFFFVVSPSLLSAIAGAIGIKSTFTSEHPDDRARASKDPRARLAHARERASNQVPARKRATGPRASRRAVARSRDQGPTAACGIQKTPKLRIGVRGEKAEKGVPSRGAQQKQKIQVFSDISPVLGLEYFTRKWVWYPPRSVPSKEGTVQECTLQEGTVQEGTLQECSLQEGSFQECTHPREYPPGGHPPRG